MGRAASKKNTASQDAGGVAEDHQREEESRRRERMRWTYYPLFDALLLLLLRPARFAEALAGYLREEARYRSALALRSAAWFFLAALFLGGAAIFALYAGFRLTETLIGNTTAAAGVWAGAAVLLAGLFVYRAVRLAARLFEADPQRPNIRDYHNPYEP